MVVTVCLAQAARADDTVVVQWNGVTLAAVKVAHIGPPVVARALAVVDTCMFNAWTAYDQRAEPTTTSAAVRRPIAERTDSNKRKAVSFAAYRAILNLFPTDTKNGAGALMTALGYDATDTSTDATTPAGIGNVACAALIEARRNDGSNQYGLLGPSGAPYSDYTGYVPVNTPDAISDPNRWQPLCVPASTPRPCPAGNTQHAVAPFWGKVLPFNPKIKIPPTEGPDFYPGRDYGDGVDRILKYSEELTDTTKTIAEYWADFPGTYLPPGHWSTFAQFVSQRDGHTLDQDVKMFFAQSNAILDASIVSWGLKSEYDYIRPVSAVHFLKAGKQVTAWAGPGLGTRTIDGGAWQPYQPANVITPPFSEYLSGHSIFSGAGAEVLKRFTGSDYFGFTFVKQPGTSDVEPGLTPATAITLSFNSFTEAANQAGLSRRYGGIHFIPGDLDARALGHKIGARDWKLAVEYFEGRLHDGDDGDDD